MTPRMRSKVRALLREGEGEAGGQKLGRVAAVLPKVERGMRDVIERLRQGVQQGDEGLVINSAFDLLEMSDMLLLKLIFDNVSAETHALAQTTRLSLTKVFKHVDPIKRDTVL